MTQSIDTACSPLSDAPVATLRSVCPYDCPDACGMLVEVMNGMAVRVSGDPDHPVTKGFLCPKMNHYEQTVHSPRRLTTPLLRRGAKGEGKFEPLSWSEATALICEQWKRLCAEFGSQCILPYSYAGTMGLLQRNSGHAFFHYLGASRLERTICSPAKEAGWKALMGDTPAMQPEEMQHSDLIILWGINAAATSIHAMRDAVKARSKGARLWVIDTYRTPTMDVADDGFIVKPGGDGALALGMMHVIWRDGLLNQEFIAENVKGFAEFCDNSLKECTPVKMSPVCGLPPETIERMALEYGRASSPFIRLGSGLTRYANGAMTVRSISCLPAMTGAWLRPGGGIFCGTSTGAAFPLHLLTREDFISEPVRIINMNRLGNALDAALDPPVKSLYVYHSNPASIAPDQNAVIRGLLRDDLFTVVHERFMTDTARYADIVLPATSSLEHPDLYRSYGSYHAQLCDAVIPAVGDSKSNRQVFSALASGMGWEEPFFKLSEKELLELLLGGVNPWRSLKINEQLRKGEPVLLTPPSDPKKEWKTISGKIELLNSQEPEPFPRVLPANGENDRYPLRFQSAVTPYALNSSFYEQDLLRDRQLCMFLMMNESDAAERGLADKMPVTAYNDQGEVEFTLQVTDRTPAGTVVTEGIWWLEFLSGNRGVNALTSQRLTDSGRGSTLYDVAVEVKRRI